MRMRPPGGVVQVVVPAGEDIVLRVDLGEGRQVIAGGEQSAFQIDLDLFRQGVSLVARLGGELRQSGQADRGELADAADLPIVVEDGPRRRSPRCIRRRS